VRSHRASGGTAVEEITAPAVIDECLRTWLPDLFAYLLGAGVTRPLASWRLEAALTDRRTRAALRVALELARLFDDPPAARAWARRRNPELSGLPPADVIRLGTEDEMLRVRDLAERELQKK
jgi:hypothetical protein